MNLSAEKKDTPDLLSTRLPEYHSVVIAMDIELEFSYYSAIRFSYSVANAKFREAMNSIRILLFSCVGYAFISSLSTLTIRFKSKFTTSHISSARWASWPQIRFVC
jgi:hypothetical protein